MAWNTPGSGSGDNGSGNGSGGGRNSWKPGRGAADNLLAQLRGLLAGGGGGGGPLRWIGLIVLLILAFSSFQLVGEQERGVVLRFGQFARIMQPGPNIKWPWPIESVRNVSVTTIGTFSNTLPVLTNDENIVSVTVNVQYRIDDPRQYLYGTQDADQVLQQAAQSAVREQVGRATLEDVLNKRGPLGTAAKTRLQAALNAYRSGMVVTDLTLPNARPPDEVKPAFDDVNSAQQSRERLVNEAQAYAARVVPEARGEAARTRTAAGGYKEAAIANAAGDADRFTLLQQQYANAPESTRKRLWLETMEQVLAHNRKVVGADGRQIIYVPMDGGAQGGNRLPAASVLPRLPTDVLMPQVDSSGNSSASSAADSLRPARPTGREEARP